jgi:hypothetical protein
MKIRGEGGREREGGREGGERERQNQFMVNV